MLESLIQDVCQDINNNIDFVDDLDSYPELQYGASVLSIACFFKSINCVKKLVSDGANVNHIDSIGKSSLIFAADSNCYEIMEVLLNNGANPNGIGNYLLRTGKNDLFMRLFISELIPIHDYDFTRSNYLHLSSYSGAFDVVDLLLRKEAYDINQQDYEGRTCLHLACGNGHHDVVGILLKQKGIDINIRDSFDKPPLHYALSQEYYEIVELFFGGKLDRILEGGYTILQQACRDGEIGIVKLFMSIPIVNINQKNKNGLTALHYASNFGRKKIISELLKNNVIDVNSQDNKGKTALHYSAENNELEIFEMLLRHPKICSTIKDFDGKTPGDYLNNKT